MKKTDTILPELLAPCGSPEALDAAIAAGADAVYFGGASFNARMNAKNFDGGTLRDAIEKCRTYGVKTNITLNTLIHDREMDDVLRYAEQLYILGADALIVADLGAARLIHRYFPDFSLHASTQAAGHNTDAAKIFADMGFSRMVAARELSFDDLTTLCRNAPIETELFIHGAICVSQSGQCLASSLIGGRSGNRGECAQPCRLPYKKCGGKAPETYALSIKDMCLAVHIPEIISLGAASLKIEGRMKSPDYVYGVTSIYRRLLDEHRSADAAELDTLRTLFSRSGFTDGYFTGKLGKTMLGIRTDADKASSAANSQTTDYTILSKNRRRPLDMMLTIEKDRPSKLTISDRGTSVTVCGAVPDLAKSCPLTNESVTKNLTKLGNTPFLPGTVDIRLDDGLILPVSALNALRRDAVDALTTALLPKRECRLPNKPYVPEIHPAKSTISARFHSYDRIPHDTSGLDVVYLPLESFTSAYADRVSGVILPPVIFDSKRAEVEIMLKNAQSAGIRHALVSNPGHIALARDAGMTLHGDFRLNIFNRYTADALYELGFADLMASPELTLPKLRDLALPPVLYGRIPLMTLEKCVIRDLYGCDACKKSDFHILRDRRNAEFPLARAWAHRNVLYNSVPVYMADRSAELTQYRIAGGHLIFTDESADRAAQILGAYLNNQKTTPPDGGFRRISK